MAQIPGALIAWGVDDGDPLWIVDDRDPANEDPDAVAVHPDHVLRLTREGQLVSVH